MNRSLLYIHNDKYSEEKSKGPAYYKPSITPGTFHYTD